jgi:GT2 family glycosyltransferase
MTVNVEVIVMVYRSGHVLGSFLQGLGRELPVLLIDNSFGDEDLSTLLADYPNVRHIDAGGNIGFSAAANAGARASTAPYLVFMNPDTRPTATHIEELVRFLEQHPDVAACGAAGNGTAGGGALPTMRRVLAHTLGLHRRRPFSGIYYQQLDGADVEVEWIAGSCMAIRSSVFQAVGGYDPDYFIYMSDFDLGLRLQLAGHKQMLLGDVLIPHDDGGSSDLPQLWTWQRRGRGWIRFLWRTRSLVAAMGLSLVLIGGNAVRSLLYGLRGNRKKAIETRAYAVAMVGELIRRGDSGRPA